MSETSAVTKTGQAYFQEAAEKAAKEETPPEVETEEVETEVETDPPPDTSKGKEYVPPDERDPQKWAERVGYWRGKTEQRESELKQAGSLVEQLTDHNQKLSEQLKLFLQEQGQKGQQATVEKLQTELEEAASEGDHKKMAELSVKIAQASTQKSEIKFPDPPKVEKPKPQAKEPDPYVNEAAQRWALELDEQQNYKRPWAHPNHPRFKDVQDALVEFSKDQSLVAKGPHAILDAIDQRMNPKKRNGSVLPPGETRAPSSGTSLSTAEKRTAYAMFPKLTKAEAEKKYAKGKEMT